MGNSQASLSTYSLRQHQAFLLPRLSGSFCPPFREDFLAVQQMQRLKLRGKKACGLPAADLGKLVSLSVTQFPYL